jgi:predicted metal-dependent hydrolase
MAPIKLRRTARSKYIRISIHSSGEVVVSAPKHIPQTIIQKFVSSKEAWIKNKLEYFKKHPYIKPAPSIYTTAHYKKHKEEARALIQERLDHFNTHYKASYGRVSIKNQKSRWGSCSKRGNLNFNYRILFLPKDICDYVIVHEICHLKELNHSKRFWKLVAETVPNYAELRKQLRAFSM